MSKFTILPICFLQRGNSEPELFGSANSQWVWVSVWTHLDVCSKNILADPYTENVVWDPITGANAALLPSGLTSLICHDDTCSLLIKRNSHTHTYLHTHTHTLPYPREILTKAIKVWTFPASALTPAPKHTSSWQLQAQRKGKEKKNWQKRRQEKSNGRKGVSFFLIQTRLPYLLPFLRPVPPLRQSRLRTGYWGNETRGISLPNTAY